MLHGGVPSFAALTKSNHWPISEISEMGLEGTGKLTVAMDQRDGWIWLDGAFLPWKDAHVHVLTHGLHYGSSVFEGIRAYGGRIFKLREHSLRLFASARAIDVPIPFDLDEIEAAILECTSRNNIDDGYIRPLVWRGSETISAGAPDSSVSVAVACWSWPSYFSALDKASGLKLTFGKTRRPPPDCGFPQAKAAGGYMITTVEKHRALRAGFHDALLLDHEGNIAEATSSNVFFVEADTLVTPKADRFLNGITRQTVIEISADLGLKVSESRLKPNELGRFSECFLTGTASEISAVGRVDDVVFQGGPIANQVQDAFRARVTNVS